MTKELRPFLSVREFADLLGVTEKTIYFMVEDGQLPHIRVNRSIRIHRDTARVLFRPATKPVTVKSLKKDKS